MILIKEETQQAFVEDARESTHFYLTVNKGKELSIYSVFPRQTVPQGTWREDEEKFLFLEVFCLIKSCQEESTYEGFLPEYQAWI